MTEPRLPRSYEAWIYALFMDRFQARFNRLIARQVAPGQRVLDAGCGTGSLSLLLAPAATEVVGVDVSDAMLAAAEQRRRRAGLANLMLRRADLAVGLRDEADGSFDVAVMSMVLHALPHAIHHAVLGELARLAATVLIVDFQAPQPWRVAGVRNWVFELCAGPTHFRAFRDFEARGGVPAIAADAGLSCRQLREVDARSLGFFEVGRGGEPV